MSWGSLEAAPAGIIPDFITDAIDLKVVCPPDSMMCPHGGRAFRDRNHDCQFTPCEFVPAPTTAPTAPPGTARTRNASEWFRNDEFVVPRVTFRELRRGKLLGDRVARVLRDKAQRASAYATSFAFAATVDVVAVPTLIDDDALKRKAKRVAHGVIVNEALSISGDLALAQQGTLLVAARKPLARFAFFGWLVRYPTPENVRKMLELVQDAHSLATLVKAQASNATTSDAFVATLKPKVIVALPTLVVPVDSTSIGSDPSGGSERWFPRQPSAVQAQVFAFLERRLKALGIVSDQSSEPPLTTIHTATRTQDAANVNTNAATLASGAETMAAAAALSHNTSLAFAAGYRGVSASIAAFLTPLSSLVGDNRQDGTRDNATANGTFAKNASTVWNFTMLRCDVFDELVRTHPSIPFTAVQGPPPAPELPLMVRPSRPAEPSRKQPQQQPSGRDSGSVEIVLSSAARAESVVFSCWVYQQLEDMPELSTVNVSSMAAVRFEQQQY